MTALGDHATAELDLAGIVDPVRAAVINIVGTFADFDPGTERQDVIDKVNTLLQFKPLSPLTNDPDEWLDRSSTSGERPLWQSTRDPDAWSHDHGVTYWYQSDVAAVFTSTEAP